MMKVAVLMSTYNGENFLEEQLRSILCQQGDFALDLWVRDDGSRDGTPALLETYAREGKLRWYTGENLKPAKSFLDLLHHCPGYDYYAFADQDDVWYPDKLQRGIDRLKDCDGPGIAFSNARLVDGKLQSLGRNVYKRPPQRDFYSLLIAGNVLGCTMLLNGKMAALVQEKPVPEIINMHDYYLLNLCTLFGGTVAYEETPCMDYRQHGANVVGAKWTKRSALQDRLRRILQPARVSIATQARTILQHYGDAPEGEKLAFLRQVADYRRSFFTAARLACSPKPRFNGKNMELTIRLAILLRNR